MLDKKYEEEIALLKRVYQDSYKKYSYSPKSLLWNTDKMNIRYDNLIRHFSISEGTSILDVGCGFGDINKYLAEKGYSEYYYMGIDITDEFIDVAKKTYREHNINFKAGDFLSTEFKQKFDYILMSGVFNYRLNMNSDENYEYLFDFVNKAFRICSKGVSFNFIIDIVDFKNNNVAYHNPSIVLEYAYKLSKRICFYNDYMPFESSVYISKDDSFGSDTMIFNEYIRENVEEFSNGVFRYTKK